MNASPRLNFEDFVMGFSGHLKFYFRKRSHHSQIVTDGSIYHLAFVTLTFEIVSTTQKKQNALKNSTLQPAKTLF